MPIATSKDISTALAKAVANVPAFHTAAEQAAANIYSISPAPPPFVPAAAGGPVGGGGR